MRLENQAIDPHPRTNTPAPIATPRRSPVHDPEHVPAPAAGPSPSTPRSASSQTPAALELASPLMAPKRASRGKARSEVVRSGVSPSACRPPRPKSSMGVRLAPELRKKTATKTVIRPIRANSKAIFNLQIITCRHRTATCKGQRAPRPRPP